MFNELYDHFPGNETCQSSKQFTFSKPTLTRRYLTDCAKPGNFVITIRFFSAFVIHYSVQHSFPSYLFLKNKCCSHVGFLTSSHAQRYFPKEIYHVTHQHRNCKNRHTIAATLTGYHPSTLTFSLEIVTDGGPNIAPG